MAWGDLKKEDLVKAGLDPDQFKTVSEKIEKAASKDDITELKNALATTQETLKTLEASLRTVAAAGGSPADSSRHQNQDDQNGGRQQQQPQGGPQGPITIDPLEFMENPTAAVRRIMSEGVTPITLHTLNVAAEMSYNMAKQRLPHFERFEAEIKELWQKYTPQQKGKPDELIENLYNLVRGRHLDEIMTDTNKKEGKYNLVQAGGTSVIGRNAGGESGGRKPEDDLSPRELEIAGRFDMTPEEWQKQKGGLKYV